MPGINEVKLVRTHDDDGIGMCYQHSDPHYCDAYLVPKKQYEDLLAQIAGPAGNDGKISLYGGKGYVSLEEVMGSDNLIEDAARVSYGIGTRKATETRGLIRYLVSHKHTSPLEHGVLRFRMKIPIFVMRQHIRHRMSSTSEYSGRYSEMVDDMFVPELSEVCGQHAVNKQGSGDELDPKTQDDALRLMQESVTDCYTKYKKLLELGVSREIARTVLPLANFTELYWKIDLHNFMHYLTLRTDGHAQKQIRDLANAMLQLAEPHFPLCFEAWRDYRQQSKTLSRMEQSLLAALVSNDLGSAPGTMTRDELFDSYGKGFRMNKREWNEFFDWYDTLMLDVG